MKTFKVDVAKGKIIVPSTLLNEYLGNKPSTIAGWKSRGLETFDNKDNRNRYEFNYVLEWKSLNVQDRFSPKKKKKETTVTVDTSKEKEQDISDVKKDMMSKLIEANQLLDAKNTSFESAERIKKVLDALLVGVSIGIKTGELIPKKDTEKVILEIIAVMLSGYHKDIKLLPRECAHRTEEEIGKILTSSYKGNMENFQKIAKSDVSKDKSVISVIERTVELLSGGISVEDILEKLN